MPGRPRSFDRDAAAEAALEAFWEQGYDTTSIAQLTATMGIRPPSLYAAFGDKDALFGEVAERYIERLRRGLSNYLDAPTAREGVQRLLDGTAFHHTEPETPAGCLVFSEPRLADERARTRATIAARIERGRVEGDVSAAVDPYGFAVFVSAVLAGMSARARDGASHHEVLKIARLAMDAWPDPAEEGALPL